MFNLIFEEVTKDNLEQVINIQKSIFPFENGRQNYIESINKDGNRKEMIYWIVFNESQEEIGTLGLYSYHEYPEDAWVGWYGVLENQRGKGYGNKILDHFEYIACQKGYKSMRLYTDESNNLDAINLYRKRDMIEERYENQREDMNLLKDTLIFSKSLSKTPIKGWDNKFLDLTKQFKKEKEHLNI